MQKYLAVRQSMTPHNKDYQWALLGPVSFISQVTELCMVIIS